MTETKRPLPPQPRQQQSPPGHTDLMDPRPDHGEESYKGSGRLTDKVAIITGADSGIGRAVAIAFAREGADVVISYLDEEDDARDTAEWVEKAGRRVLLIPGDITSEAHCRAIVDKTVETFGRVDILRQQCCLPAHLWCDRRDQLGGIGRRPSKPISMRPSSWPGPPFRT